MVVECGCCFHNCRLEEGSTGFCRARMNKDGRITAKNYGMLTSLSLDPVRKKPLALFYPDKFVFSVGSFGCNMRCAFCQNHEISQNDFCADGGQDFQREYVRYFPPENIAEYAYSLRSRDNIGVAYTYNEPLVGWEYVRDVSKLVREYGMKNVIVTNGCVSSQVLDEILPFIDAMNIDCKCFTKEHYSFLGGDFDSVVKSIEKCAERCHVEITTLIVPGFNDSVREIKEMASWLSTLKSFDGSIALHITRFFPRWKMTDTNPTPIGVMHELADAARIYLPDVFLGNC